MPDDESIQRMAPYIRQAYQLTKDKQTDEAYRVLLPHFREKAMPVFFEDTAGWVIYGYLKLHKDALSSVEFRTCLSYYVAFCSGKPSLCHSLIMVLAERFKDGHAEFRFTRFCLLWHLDGFRPEDFLRAKGTDHEGKPITYPALVEKVASRLYQEQKSRPEAEDCAAVLPFLERVRQTFPDNENLPLYVAAMKNWSGQHEEAIAELKDLLCTAPKWFLWQALGDIVGDQELRMACYCKALLTNGNEEFIGKLRLALATLIRDSDKPQAAHELSRYLTTYQSRQWHIADTALSLQRELSGITPATQPRRFYDTQSQRAEAFVYQHIAPIEMTLMGIAPNKAGKQRARLSSLQPKVSLSTPVTPELRRAAVGDIFSVRTAQQNGRTVALTIQATGRKNERVTNNSRKTIPSKANASPHSSQPQTESKTVEGIFLQKESQEYGFIDRTIYVHALIIKAEGLTSGQRVRVKAIQNPDGKWRVAKVIKD